jgi:hypothetical protein
MDRRRAAAASGSLTARGRSKGSTVANGEVWRRSVVVAACMEAIGLVVWPGVRAPCGSGCRMQHPNAERDRGRASILGTAGPAGHGRTASPQVELVERALEYRQGPLEAGHVRAQVPDREPQDVPAVELGV